MPVAPGGGGQRQVQLFAAADLGPAGGPPRGDGGDRGVDLADHRACVGQRIDRPDRGDPAQGVEHTHPAEARFADLRRTDQVEVRCRRAAHRGLRRLGHAHAAAPACEPVAGAAAMPAEMAGDFGMVDKAADAKVRIGRGHAIDHGPQRRCIGRAVIPAGKECPGIGKGQGNAKVHPDQRIARRLVADPAQHFGARPDMARPHRLRRRIAWCTLCERNAAMPFTRRARPVDRDEMAKPRGPHSLSRPARRRFHHSIRRNTSRSNPRSTGR